MRRVKAMNNNERNKVKANNKDMRSCVKFYNKEEFEVNLKNVYVIKIIIHSVVTRNVVFFFTFDGIIFRVLRNSSSYKNISD